MQKLAVVFFCVTAYYASSTNEGQKLRSGPTMSFVLPRSAAGRVSWRCLGSSRHFNRKIVAGIVDESGHVLRTSRRACTPVEPTDLSHVVAGVFRVVSGHVSVASGLMDG